MSTQASLSDTRKPINNCTLLLWLPGNQSGNKSFGLVCSVVLALAFWMSSQSFNSLLGEDQYFILIVMKTQMGFFTSWLDIKLLLFAISEDAKNVSLHECVYMNKVQRPPQKTVILPLQNSGQLNATLYISMTHSISTAQSSSGRKWNLVK